MNNFLDYMKENSGCLYIYNRSSAVYGLSDKEFAEYLIVVDRGFIFPEDWIGLVKEEYFFQDYDVLIEDNTKFIIYKIDTWFNLVLKGDIICWECACLNKKYVIKEHVKLMMKTDPLQLRKQIDRLISDKYDDFVDLWRVILYCKFANQIIENHKIVNFKEASVEYTILRRQTNDSELIERYQQDLALPYQLLKDSTDEILKQSKIKKILQNE